MWLKRHSYAETSIENREELLQESTSELETNLTLLGNGGKSDATTESSTSESPCGPLGKLHQ